MIDRERDVQEWSFWTTLGTLYSGLVKCPSKVSEQKRIWRTVLPIALLVLVMGTTLGGVWHRHAISSPDACPICHLSHQAIEPTLASTRAIHSGSHGTRTRTSTLQLHPESRRRAHSRARSPRITASSFTCRSRHTNPCTCPLRRLTSHAFTAFAVSSFVCRSAFFRSCRCAIPACPKSVAVSPTSTSSCPESRSGEDFARRRHSDGTSAQPQSTGRSAPRSSRARPKKPQPICVRTRCF